MALNYSIALLVALLLAGGGMKAAADVSEVDPAAVAVAQSYFTALQAGDVDSLLSLLGGDERSQNLAQLSDPEYPQYLVDRYRNARFEVTGGGVKSGVSFVDVRIRLNQTESFKERLILDSDPSSMHIVARMELESE